MPSKTRCRAKDKDNCSFHHPSKPACPVQPSGVNPKTGEFTSTRPPLDKHKVDSQWFEFLLSKDEAEAVRKYLNQDYMAITPYVYGYREGETGYREDRERDKQVAKQVKLLDSALAKYDRKEAKVVYRATSVRDIPHRTRQEAAEAIAERYPIGKVITVDGYMSTTANPEALFDFVTRGYDDESHRPSILRPTPDTFEEKVERRGPDKSLTNVFYEISTPSGAPVSSFGHTYADKEQEYLLGRGKKFQVVEVIPRRKMVNPVQGSGIPSTHATVVRLVEVL